MGSSPTPAEIAAFTRRASQNPLELKALNDGVVDGPMVGVPLLLLHSTGRDRVWPALRAYNPTFAEYEKTTSRVMPVFELVR